MKDIKYMIVAMSVIFCNILTAQEASSDFTDKASALALTVIIPDQVDNIPDGAKSYLANKFNRIATKNGIVTSEEFGRFFITAVITPLTKDIVPGPPQQIAQNMEITFYIADYFEQKVFSSTTLNVRAVGTNETKCYIDGIKNINVNSKELSAFIDNGKKKIIDYYNSQCTNIIKETNSLAKQKKYEEALYKISSIPKECDCYDEALNVMFAAYRQYTDFLCEVNLAKAKMVWAANQNSDGAESVGEYLQYIYPDAECYGDAQALYKEIKGKILDDWKFVMKIYNDQIVLEKQRIAAITAVGVAYGNNQKPATYNVAWLVR